MNIETEILNRSSKKIVNENVLSPKLRDIEPAVIKIMKNLGYLRLIGYTRTIVDPISMFEIEFENELIKVNKNNKASFDRYSIDLNDNKVYVMKFYFLLSEDVPISGDLDQVYYNTRRLLEADPPEVLFEEDALLKKILEAPEVYIPDFPEEDRENYDILYRREMLLPKVVDGAFLLGGLKYYQAFYLNNANKSNGKMEIINKLKEPFKNMDEVSSYIWVNNDGLIRYMFLGIEMNPFVFTDYVSIDEVKLAFSDFFDNDMEPNTNEGKILVDTFEDYVRNHKEFLTEINTVDEDDYKSKNAFAKYKEVDKGEVINAIEAVLNGHDEIRLDIHKSMNRYLKSSIIVKFPKRSNKRREPIKHIKKRLNLRPEAILLIIKNKKQYSSTVSKSTNVIDIYNKFMYISELESADNVGKSQRKLKQEYMKVISPAATSQSDNIGLSGMCVFSINDKYIKDIEEVKR